MSMFSTHYVIYSDRRYWNGLNEDGTSAWSSAPLSGCQFKTMASAEVVLKGLIRTNPDARILEDE